MAGPRLGLAPFGALSQHLELGDVGMLGVWFTPLRRPEDISGGGRKEGAELFWELR